MSWHEFAEGMKTESDKSVVKITEWKGKRGFLVDGVYHILDVMGNILYHEAILERRGLVYFDTLVAPDSLQLTHSPADYPDGRTKTYIKFLDDKQAQDFARNTQLTGVSTKKSEWL